MDINWQARSSLFGGKKKRKWRKREREGGEER